jgi:hypothetical protein
MVLKDSSNDPEEEDEQDRVDGKKTAHTCFSQMPEDHIVCVFVTAASHMNCWQRRCRGTSEMVYDRIVKYFQWNIIFLIGLLFLVLFML